MYPKIKSIKILNNFKLQVLFDNSVTKIVDFTKKFDESIYEDLQNEILFRQAKVDSGGYGVSWNDDIDISEYELWNIGIKSSESDLTL
ncbi:MAG: DUF2442 domain-containing protein [Sarcina sp.]